ncbi:MAG TPA: UDP-4-amino-4,6-dideoxy-N-acetyl-beta-L-altrosamine transaminase [Candidatus Binataceae bacterium]|nr:UDP-4-amino-4,6-dideoxy-N-acetyl-beta-L-altrosamine transaminase [Candidatus Binataceae bacterium]
MTVARNLPYGRQWIDDNDVAAVVDALRSDWLTTGPRVEQFESALAAKVGARYAVVASSGTAALHLACMAADVGPGGVVISSPNTFVASTNCALYCGARPAFADIDSETLNLDPSALAHLLNHLPSGQPQAVIPVHFAGQPCAMEQISSLARSAGLRIIEDACHALGARWRDRTGRWQSVGNCSHSDMTVFSFHPVKHITSGEGGAITTNDQQIYERLRRLRHHGIGRTLMQLGAQEPWRHEITELGYNYRLSDIQCALGLSQLRKLEGWVERRRALAARYDRELADLSEVKRPAQAANNFSSYHLYVVQVPRRSALFHRLHERGIKTQVHYLPVHLHPLYRERFGYRAGDFPKAEAYYEGALSLPLFPQMSDNDVTYVAEVLREALAEHNLPKQEPQS